MTKIEELAEFGQSVWLDYISRSMIASGKLRGLIDKGLRGMTSNPTIFDKAISASNDYDQTIAGLKSAGKTTFEIYDELTVRDVRDAADIFGPLYEKTDGLDGYVSLEVNPKLAFKAQETIDEALRLHAKVNRPNVMFKVPSTKEGLQAVGALVARGINVNITLIFSREQYVHTADAYMNGMTRFLENGGDARRIRSVASVFVSRIDTACDKLLDQRIEKEADQKKSAALTALKGRAAVANSLLIYKQFNERFSSKAFAPLKSKNVNLQRVLWGSTGTKNPAYNDIKYVTELTAPDTVNTMPEATFEAFLDHGVITHKTASDAQAVIDDLKTLNIDIDAICAQLLQEGVMAFEKSFDALLGSIEEKANAVCKAEK